MICSTILTLAGLWAARAVMTPVAFALFIIALVWPLHRRPRAFLPQVTAVLLTTTVALLAIGSGWLQGGGAPTRILLDDPRAKPLILLVGDRV
jgi:predicted PurR-regulated permease PerM